MPPQSQRLFPWLRGLSVRVKSLLGILAGAALTSLVGLTLEYKSGWFMKPDPAPTSNPQPPAGTFSNPRPPAGPPIDPKTRNDTGTDRSGPSKPEFKTIVDA